MAGSVFRLVVSCSCLIRKPPKFQAKSIPNLQKLYFAPSSVNFARTIMSTPTSATPEPVPQPAVEPTPEETTTPPKEEEVESKPEATNGKSETVTPIIDEAKEYMKRVRRRKMAIMLSYCGQSYYGMQRNPETKTIEEELFNSFLKNNYFDEEAFKRPQLAQFQRAARTDKHVSAARQIVSVKIAETISAEQLNEHLPPEIRVMGVKRVTQGFDAKKNCDARTYMYMTPTFAFAPIDVPVTESYRITPERIEEIRKTLNLYLGPKNFHNFTSRKRAHDPSAVRIIYSFTCSEPFEKDGLEYVLLRVRGQSFMMHQIRKMIGLVIAYMRGFANLETFTKCWTADRIDVPRAPGVGLLLDHVHYDRYDKRFGKDGMHDPMTWDSVEDKVQKFCDEYIFPVITQSENIEKSMMTWLTTLPYHTYDVREDHLHMMDEDERNINKADMSGIGKAFRAIVHRTGTEPKFCTKRIPGREDDSDDGEDDDDDEFLAAKKPKVQTAEG